MSELSREDASKLVAKHGSIRKAALATRISRHKITMALYKATEGETNQTPAVDYLRTRVRELEALRTKDRVNTGAVEEALEELRTAISVAEPVKMNYAPPKKSSTPCTHVLHLTDIHYGAQQASEEVDGYGENSPAITEARMQKLGQMLIHSTKTKRHGFHIPRLHIIGTADYISGDIHQELLVNNAFPAPQQAVGCGYMLGAFGAMLAPHFEQVTFDLVTLDNHGRLTAKPQAVQGGVNNWGYVVASIAKQYLSRQNNVDIRIHAKPSASVDIGPERYTAFHGHQIRGWAGKPYYGFDRRVMMEALKCMDMGHDYFTKLLIGHFHVAANDVWWQVGGSVSGTDAFDHGQGRHSKPHQTSWIVHDRHGEFDWTRWWLWDI